jgi:hypothetical protein
LVVEYLLEDKEQSVFSFPKDGLPSGSPEEIKVEFGGTEIYESEYKKN